jgi:RNA polymerase sigma factor (sigma-70 family)
MRDRDMAAAIVAGDPDGLAEAYDRYASPLYGYCRSLLREPADAADAVQDTFVIAASRLGGLRDQNRLRAWLYAVARNECLRRLREGAARGTSALEHAPELADEAADVTGGAERAELRTLLRAALRGLNPGDADLIEMQLSQGLEVAEIAAVLRVSRNHAHALLSRARGQLQTSLGALLVARSGRQDCPALDGMLQGWDGELTALTRKRVNRHIDRCPTCAERRRRELAPELLLGLAPLLALPLAVPPGLREQALRLAGSNGPDALARRADASLHAAPFGQNGFPEPLARPKPGRWRARPAQAAAAAAVVAAAAAAISLALPGGGGAGHGGRAALGAGGAAGGAGPSGAVPGATSPVSRGRSTAPAPANGVVHTSPAPGGGLPSPAAGGSPGGGSPGGGSPAGSGSPPAGASPTATAPSSVPGTSPGSPAPSASGTPPASSPPPSSSAPPPAPGTLSVSPRTIVLSPLLGGSITLTASGGPVTWSIAESSGLVGKVSVFPASGTLAAGHTVTVSLSSSLVSLDSQLTVDPGGIAVTVVAGLGV